MSEFEAWLEFRRQERWQPAKRPLCYWCGRECSGDTTMDVEVDGQHLGSVPVCDEEADCQTWGEDGAMDLEARILKLTWTQRRSLESLRRGLGLPHKDVVVLVFAVKALLEAGKLRIWGSVDWPGETLYIAA